MKFLPIVALMLVLLAGGCSRKAEVKKVGPSMDIVKAAIVDFAQHIPKEGDTLYIALRDQDPPAGLLEQVQSARVTFLPASQKAAGSVRTTFTMYPDSSTVGDSVSLNIKWQVGDRGAMGSAIITRHGDNWAVNWSWGSPFGS